jgi:phosphate starvation-inducible protein PhoH
MKKILPSLCAILLLTGCQTTSDPSKGGLFSYSPKAYEQRAAERQERLNELQREQAAEEQRRVALQQTAAQKQSEHSAMQQQLQRVNAESADLKKRLDTVKVMNAAQQAALDDIKAHQARLQADIQAAQAGTGSEAARQAEAQRLRREIVRLARETEALSNL